MWDTYEWLKQILETNIPEYRVELGQELSSKDSRNIRRRKTAEIFVDEWKAEVGKGQGCGARIWRIQLINQQLDSISSRWLTDDSDTTLGLYNAAKVTRDALAGQQTPSGSNPIIALGGKLKSSTRAAGIWEESFAEYLPSEAEPLRVYSDPKYIGETVSTVLTGSNSILINETDNLSEGDTVFAKNEDGQFTRLGKVSTIAMSSFELTNSVSVLLPVETNIFCMGNESNLPIHPSAIHLSEISDHHSNQTLAETLFQTITTNPYLEIELSFNPISKAIESSIDSIFQIKSELQFLYFQNDFYQIGYIKGTESESLGKNLVRKTYKGNLLLTTSLSEELFEDQS